MNTWKCTRCELEHNTPALVLGDSGLPFCNDLCKAAHQRDSEVNEMHAQFIETSKRIAEWRESRQVVFEGLRLRVEPSPAKNIERLIRRESELTASVHELLEIAKLAAYYLPGELKERPEKVYAAIDRAQALVDEESYHA
jgi:hypothetical protein